MNPSSRRAGFSLIELLVAMGIFSAMGIAIVSLLSRASDFSRAGTSTTEMLDKLQSFAEAFTADTSAIASRHDRDDGAPDVRLYSDVVRSDVDGDSKADASIQRLLFVRMVPDEATDSITRTAGTSVDAKAYVDQTNDLEEASKGQLRATGGHMEVFWTAVPESKDDLAVMTLYRGIRSPIGGPDSLFPSKVSTEPSATKEERKAIDLAEIRKVARPLLTGVLHFGVDFWAGNTETWDASFPPPKGPLQVWDSTRGVLPKGRRTEGFEFAAERGSMDRPSLADPTDDTFPRRLRVTLVVEESGRSARVGFLMAPIAADSGVVDLSDTRFIPATDTSQRFVKIGPEWIEFQSIEGTKLTGCKRGARGTLAQGHEQGARVHYGRTLVLEASNATYRDAVGAYQDLLGGRRR